MSAVFIRDRSLDPFLRWWLAEREAKGLDRLDECWEGVLHMSPPPHGDHQRLGTRLVVCLEAQARRYDLGEVLMQAGIREPGSPPLGPDSNYRVPDLVVLPPKYRLIDGWVEAGASLVIEIRSPRETAREKLAFYAKRKIPDALYIDSLTLEPTLYDLRGGIPIEVSPDREGFVLVRSLDLRVRRVEGPDGPRLEIEDARGGGPLPQPQT